MGSPAERSERALRASTRLDVLRALRPRRHPVTVPDVQRLTQRLRSFAETRQPLRLAVLRTYGTELLRPYWELETLLQGFALELYEGPFGAVLQEVQPDSGLVAHRPDVTCVFLSWEDLDPCFARPLVALSPAEREAAAERALGRLEAMIGPLRAAVSGLVVVTLLPRFRGAALGAHDTMVADSEADFHARLKRDLAARLRRTLPSVSFEDLDTLAEEIGRRGMFDVRLWHAARFPFSVAGAQAVVRRLMVYPVLLHQPRRKCIVLDADDTLWGGIVGEDGPSGIALGPEYPGSAFVAFQRRLLDYKARGFLLALCSKNEPADVLEVLERHPHQLLRRTDFATIRVNWLAKAENVAAIASELNLGLDALLYVDDSAQECLHVERALPQVLVVQTPSEASELAECLDDVPQLEVLSLTEEDRARTTMYADEHRRRDLAAASESLESFLAALEMTMRVGEDDPTQTARIAQLTQKTNQFNLTTRRYTEADIRRFIADPDWLVAHFSLADVFGDSGVVGVALVRGLTAGSAEVDSLLMSCRVIGRRAETAFLDHLLRVLAELGVRRVRATFVPTAKNTLVARFWEDHGFQPAGPGAWSMELQGFAGVAPPPPIRVESVARRAPDARHGALG